jgi:tripartite-type tricarboxylate transporter receptor subunit TctC
MGSKSRISAAVHFFLLLALPFALQAQNYPNRALRFLVAYPPGGANDLIGRHLAAELADGLKQPVFVENRPGAGAVIGTKALAEATPDGYTLGLVTSTSMVTGPLLYKNVAYRPLEDFTHIVMVGTFPNAFTVRADHPARTMQDLIASAKGSAKAIQYGSAGLGSIGHLTGELLIQITGIKMVHIPYKGTAQATLDLLGGRIDGMFDGLPTANQQGRAGMVRIRGVTGLQRELSAPAAPTLQEIVPGASGFVWFGVAVPRKTPDPMAARLRDELVRILAAQDSRKQLMDLGMTPTGTTGEQYIDFIQAEIRKWGGVIKAANVKVE